MSAPDKDTIVALASAPVTSALAIFRVSGPSTRRLLKNIVGFIPKNRVSTLSTLKNSDNRVFDKGLVVFFRGLNLSLVRICGIPNSWRVRCNKNFNGYLHLSITSGRLFDLLNQASSQKEHI